MSLGLAVSRKAWLQVNVLGNYKIITFTTNTGFDQVDN
jgi:hypothetical protein